jgi:hypothetical protein
MTASRNGAKDTKPAGAPDVAPPPPVVPAKPSAPQPAEQKSRRNLVPFLTLTTLIFLATTVVFGWMAFRSPDGLPLTGSRPPVTGAPGVEMTERDVIEGVAGRFLSNFLTYHYETLEEDIAVALEDATDDFEVRSLAMLAGGDLEGFKELIVQRNGVGSARLVAASQTLREEDTAIVTVTVRRTYENNQLSQPRDEFLIVDLTLVLTDDGWMVDILSEPDSAA